MPGKAFHNEKFFMKICVASLLGFLIGLVAGLLGVGGGEFRLPVLICLLGLPVRVAVAANLIIGILTVGVSLAKRVAVGIIPTAAGLVVSMSIGSVAGAYAGAHLTGKVREKHLKTAVALLLLILGLKFIHGAFTEEGAYRAVIGYPIDLGVGAILGALIGVVSGALGVAGGELRIPCLIYLFGMPVKEAGSTSLVISLPTVITGAAKHGRMGHIDRHVLYICMAMGVLSIIGAYFGAALVPGATEFSLKILLGAVLMLATVRMIKP
ncbi:MAG: sulfite exporter TauE/SafE family protein [Candidatus Hadarchaeales archaeon]